MDILGYHRFNMLRGTHSILREMNTRKPVVWCSMRHLVPERSVKSVDRFEFIVNFYKLHMNCVHKSQAVIKCNDVVDNNTKEQNSEWDCCHCPFPGQRLSVREQSSSWEGRLGGQLLARSCWSGEQSVLNGPTLPTMLSWWEDRIIMIVPKYSQGSSPFLQCLRRKWRLILYY